LHKCTSSLMRMAISSTWSTTKSILVIHEDRNQKNWKLSYVNQ